MATCSSILAWRIPWIESKEGYSPCGCEESDYPKRFSTHLLLHSQSVSVRAKNSSLSRKEERGNQLQVPNGPPGCNLETVQSGPILFRTRCHVVFQRQNRRAGKALHRGENVNLK